MCEVSERANEVVKRALSAVTVRVLVPVTHSCNATVDDDVALDKNYEIQRSCVATLHVKFKRESVGAGVK